MKRGGKVYSLFLASTALLLLSIVFLPAESVVHAQSELSAEYAYVPNEKSNTVSVINTTTNTVISTVPVGNNPCGVAVNSDGTKVYVTNFGNDSSLGRRVFVIDTATDEVTNMLVGEGIKPSGIAVTQNETIYVACYWTNNVYAIDLTTNDVHEIPVGLHPMEVAITLDESQAYVTNRHSNNVSVIDIASNSVIDTVDVGEEPYGVAINPNGTKAYVTNQASDSVSVIDTTTNKIIATVNVGKYPHGVAVTPDGKWVYVANHNTPHGTVSVINTTTDTTIQNISVGKYPCGVAITYDGKWVYVTNSGSNIVSIINTTTNTVMLKKVPVGICPSGLGQFIGSVQDSRIETITTLAPPPKKYLGGEPTTLIATVSATSKGTEKPSGAVIFTDESDNIGTEDLILGHATLDTSSLSIGSHSIIARYTGNNNFRPSTSSFILTVPEPSPSLWDRFLNFLGEFFNEIIVGLFGAAALTIIKMIKRKYLP